MVKMNNTELAKIRLKLSTFMPVLPSAMIAIFVPVTIIALMNNGEFGTSLIAGAVGVAGITPVILLICVMGALTYHIRVYADGVSSYDPFGSWKRDFVTWEDMREISGVSIMGVSYIKVDAGGAGILWIPQSAFNQRELVSAVQSIAPNSKLAGWLLNTPES